MDMRIQYGDMNPLREVGGGLATGLGLGMQLRKQREELRQRDEELEIKRQQMQQNQPNLPIQDPGEKPVVDINELTQAEQQDIAKYSDLEKKAKGLDETAMYDVRRSAVNETQSPIVKQAMVMGISAKDLSTYMKDIQTKGINSPSGQILKGRLGGENSAGWQEVQKKVAEVQATQQKLDQEYSIKLKSAISQIEDARENPQKYAKNGQAAESVLKGLQNEGNYLSTLYQMSKEDAAWVEQYLARQQAKRDRAGGNLREKSFVTYDKEGTRQVFSAIDVDEARIIAKQKGWDTAKIRDMGKEGDYVSDIIQGQRIKTENLPKVPAGDGWTDKNGKTIKEVIADGKHVFKDKNGDLWTVTKDAKGTKYNRVNK